MLLHHFHLEPAVVQGSDEIEKQDLLLKVRARSKRTVYILLQQPSAAAVTELSALGTVTELSAEDHAQQASKQCFRSSGIACIGYVF